jgi:hypothetical protein
MKNKNNPAICWPIRGIWFSQSRGLVRHEEVSAADQDHHDNVASGGQLASHCLEICVILLSMVLKQQKRIKAIDSPIESRILVKAQS